MAGLPLSVITSFALGLIVGLVLGMLIGYAIAQETRRGGKP